MAEIPGRIESNDRTFAALTHLSGLSGYIIPLGGVIVPIVIWLMRRDSPVIAGIAKQAILLNIVVFLLVGASFVLWITIILIPLALIIWGVLAIIAVVLPIVGAIKANQGSYYRYPVVGLDPGI
jgi:uncharacterized Tic20 family protein